MVHCLPEYTLGPHTKLSHQNQITRTGKACANKIVPDQASPRVNWCPNFVSIGQQVSPILSLACADPGILVKGGVQVSLSKKALTFFFVFFIFIFFLVLSLFYRTQMVNFKEIYLFSRFQRGSNFFQGGGSNCLFPLETHITCDFPGGVWTPCPPLWIRT